MVIFSLELEKPIAMLDFTTFNLSKCNISCKKKYFFKFRTKFPIWKFLGWNSKKLLYCDILHRHPQVFLNTKFHPKIKIFEFATKIALIRYFSLEFQKTNVVFEISILEFVNMKRFFEKQRDFKLVTKIILFRYFWAAI